MTKGSEFVQDFRMTLVNPLCFSLDLREREKGIALLEKIGPVVGMVKIGPIAYLSFGNDVLERAERLSTPLFLDLKWHDIPNTVHEAICSLSSPAIRMITIHALGGPSMISAARRACESLGTPRPALIAVTALTHLTRDELHRIGLPDRIETVKNLGSMALGSGADGLVLSCQELQTAREIWGKDPILVTPGIRFEDSGITKDDQNFPETPENALQKGSDLLVVGRPILQSSDPLGTVNRILSAIASRRGQARGRV